MVLLADRSGVPLPDLLGDADLPGEIGLTGDRPVGVLIGPEGGWSPAELERAIDRGIRFTRLGPHLLRTETAAIAAVACIRALCEGAS